LKRQQGAKGIAKVLNQKSNAYNLLVRSELVDRYLSGVAVSSFVNHGSRIHIPQTSTTHGRLDKISTLQMSKKNIPGSTHKFTPVSIFAVDHPSTQATQLSSSFYLDVRQAIFGLV
jgi:hypothetical protein